MKGRAPPVARPSLGGVLIPAPERPSPSGSIDGFKGLTPYLLPPLVRLGGVVGRVKKGDAFGTI